LPALVCTRVFVLQAAKLETLLSKPVTFLPNCVGEETEKAVKAGSNGQVFLLENLRFHGEEEGSSKDSEGNKIKGTYTIHGLREMVFLYAPSNAEALMEAA
jgi:3-phosphoglycerate kinase